MHFVKKHILDNGLTILIYPVTTIPKVAIQLWYNVGSKDEKDGERGLAHLLEHMIFKGTDILSESDINLIAHKLSGNCNAFTSHDYTGYLFDFPRQNWHVALPLLANCMKKCTFKEDLLNAELKTVIQELKMYKDDYRSSLCEEMMGAIFSEHPYHFPIIGYKQDLWNITRQGLLNFYAKHYIPNNAMLIIVGDVNPDEAIKLAQKAFEKIPADLNYKKEVYPYTPDLLTQSVVMRRDIQQPLLMYAWVVPGFKENKNVVIDLASWVLGEGKGSRLYKKLVDELELATDMQVDLYELFDQSIIFVHIDPIDEKVIPAIEKAVAAEIHKLQTEGVTEHELRRAGKQFMMENMALLENNQKIAYQIGKSFLANQNEDALFEYNNVSSVQFKDEVQEFFNTYLRSTKMHTGMVLPLAAEQKKQWLLLQEESDKQDAKILSRKVRESTVECGVLVEQIVAKEATLFNYPKAHKDQCANGLIVLSHLSDQTSKIDLILELKVRHYYDPEDKQGLINFMSEMMLEGTQDYTDQELADVAESRGISIDVRAGTISMSMLKDDFDFALSLLNQIVTKAVFREKNIEKIRTQICADIANYWDSPADFAGQLVRMELYKNHPYNKNLLGDFESMKKITRADLIGAYKKYVSPDGARLAVVGDIKGIDIFAAVNAALNSWENVPVSEIMFPALTALCAATIEYPINRDQTVLCFAGHSVSRLDERYDALILFDQIFSGGVLGSMSSYLLQLREQTGLFYTIGGSLVANADEQPGLIYIRTIVSNDRLTEAENLIENAIVTAPNIITAIDVDHARNALINSLVDNFESNDAMAQSFLFIDRFELPTDYFDRRLVNLRSISLEKIKEAVRSVLDVNHLIKLRIGRKT